MDLSSVFEFCKHLLVTLAAGVIVDWLMRRKRAGRANAEILQRFLGLIAEQDTQMVHIHSIIASVAREHHLNEERVYSVASLADEAITKILSDPFISAKQKQEYCLLAQRIKRESSKPQVASAKVSLRGGMRKDLAVILGGAILGAMLFSLLGNTISIGLVSVDKAAIGRLFVIAAIAIIVPALFFWFRDSYRNVDQHKVDYPWRRRIDKMAAWLKGKRRTAK
jgi:hypothetical protein